MGYKETLLSPIKIGIHNCSNRFFAQPMECVDSDTEGNPSDLTYQRYEKLYEGDFGFVSLEAISVSEESRARKTQLRILPSNEKALAKLVAHLKKINPNVVLVFQLTHSGEVSKPAFSRRVTVKELYGFPGDILTEEEVDKIIDDYVVSSKIVQAVGGDGIDLKFCHGYLGSQILRPYNDRNWKYGGPWENRRQFAFDLMERIKAGVNDRDFIIGSKLSMWEAFPGGCGSAGPDSPLMDLTESIDLVKGLEERGATYFIQSLGNVHSSMNFMEAVQDEPYLSYLHFWFADQLKKNVKPETVVIGSSFSPFRGKENKLLAIEPEKSSMFAMGARCIDDGIMDMIGLGRQSLSDPLTPLKLKEGKEDEIKYCNQCMNCEELMIQQMPVGCALYSKTHTEFFKEMRKKFGKLEELHS